MTRVSWRPSSLRSKTHVLETEVARLVEVDLAEGGGNVRVAHVAVAEAVEDDAEVALVIPPSFPLNIQTCFYGLCALDVLGVLRGWRCVPSPSPSRAVFATRPR